MRYFLELSYHGEAYHGWQRQPNAVTIQEVVENALEMLTRMKIEVVGAGRTDAGVHAKQLFAHFDREEMIGENFVFRMNSLLPKDIAVEGLYKVNHVAHARFDAISRTYEYNIVRKKDPFSINTAYFMRQKVDVDLMNKAADIMLGYSNFKCFSRSRSDVRTYNCKIEYAFWKQDHGRLSFHIKADRFLRNMVRAIVGTLLEIGSGKLELEKIHEIIRSEDRSEAGASVPAHGLFLTRIEYPKTIL